MTYSNASLNLLNTHKLQKSGFLGFISKFLAEIWNVRKYLNTAEGENTQIYSLYM